MGGERLKVRPQDAEGFGRYSRRALAYEMSVSFLVVRFFRVPKKYRRTFWEEERQRRNVAAAFKRAA